MDEIIRILKFLIEEKGITAASKYLGVTKIRNLQNWIHNNKVPDSNIGMLTEILVLKGHLK